MTTIDKAFEAWGEPPRTALERVAFRAGAEWLRAEAVKAALEGYGGRAHTYASENADIYYAQDEACKRIAAVIERLGEEVKRERVD